MIGPVPLSTWRRHLPFGVVLLAGLVLRVLVRLAYQPALFLTDSFGYLADAHHFTLSTMRPGGYSALLWVLVRLNDSPYFITAVQHMLGMGLATACYAFMVRRGLAVWAAALASTPLLFDPLQLVLEQYILSGVLFEALLVPACLVLLWRSTPSTAAVLMSALLVAAAMLTRGAATFLPAVFLVALCCLRVGWKKVAVFAVTVTLLMLFYAAAFHAEHGTYAITTSGPRFLYARLAPIASCSGIEMPTYERPLCPSKPVGERPSTDWYMWGTTGSMPNVVVPPAGMTTSKVLKDWDKRIVRNQPLPYARAALADWARGFGTSRTDEVAGFPAQRWLFHDHNWSLDEFVRRHLMRPRVLRQLGSYRPAAIFLTSYGKTIWTPGPLMALLMTAAAAAAAGIGRSRWSRDRVAVGLLLGTCLVPLLTGAALSGFSWRYQLPQIALLPVAGALGIAALAGRPVPTAQANTWPATALQRAAGWVATRAPLPDLMMDRFKAAPHRRSLERSIAVLLGLGLGLVVAAGAYVSGWATASTAAIGGVFSAIVVTGLLLRAQPGRHLGRNQRRLSRAVQASGEPNSV